RGATPRRGARPAARRAPRARRGPPPARRRPPGRGRARSRRAHGARECERTRRLLRTGSLAGERGPALEPVVATRLEGADVVDRVEERAGRGHAGAVGGAARRGAEVGGGLAVGRLRELRIDGRL